MDTAIPNLNSISQQISGLSQNTQNMANPLNFQTPLSNQLPTTQPAPTLTNSIFQPRHTVPQVNDERELYQVPMGVNSSEVVFHTTKPLAYFIATDQSGNKVSVVPIDISLHVQEPEPTMQDVRNIESHLDTKIESLKDELSQLITSKINEALK